MDALYDLKDMMCGIVEETTQKKDITPQEIEMMYKVVDIIKDISTIEAMENSEEYSYDYSNEGNSYRRYSREGQRGGMSGDGRYSERSYASRRSSRDSYSRHDEKEYLKQQINELQRKVDSM